MHTALESHIPKEIKILLLEANFDGGRFLCVEKNAGECSSNPSLYDVITHAVCKFGVSPSFTLCLTLLVLLLV